MQQIKAKCLSNLLHASNLDRCAPKHANCNAEAQHNTQPIATSSRQDIYNCSRPQPEATCAAMLLAKPTALANRTKRACDQAVQGSWRHRHDGLRFSYHNQT